jgi:hypothetical protein
VVRSYSGIPRPREPGFLGHLRLPHGDPRVAGSGEATTSSSDRNISFYKDRRAAYTAFLTETRFDCFGVYRSPYPSTRLLKLCRYLSTRLETAPPKLEVSFRVTHVLRSESDAKETTPAAK